ncbi:MAG: right-handed parallel beta-helix repeat-containing protein, partial [Candidatus Marinimicrobia bacterium]|nr:right-handed parallel beta-helix repeat-containing protein [Candidatus Neomarinimicrobiota bacterium]
GGCLTAVGTASDSIIFSSAGGNSGDWQGIQFYVSTDYGDSTSAMTYCVVEKAEYGINVNNADNVHLHHIDIRNNYNNGLVLSQANLSIENFKISGNSECGIEITNGQLTANNGTIKNNSDAIKLGANAGIDGNAVILSGNSRDYVNVSTASVSSGYDIIWGLSVEYLVENDDLDITGILRIKKGVTVKFNTGYGMTVGGSYSAGVIIAEGAADSAVTFTSKTGNSGDWKGIQFESGSDNDQASVLSNVIIENAGKTNSHSVEAALWLDNLTQHPPVIDAVTIRNTVGRSIYNASNFGSLAGLGYLELDNNTIPDIYTKGSNISATNSVRLRKYTGSDWHISSDLYIYDDTLTIDPGVTLKFADNAGLIIANTSGQNGFLKAIGTVDSMITFTSLLDTVYGGWKGIYFRDMSDADGASSTLKYCIVERAGTAAYGANIKTRNTSQPTIDHCIIRNSAGYAVWVENGDAAPKINYSDIYSHKSSYIYNASPIIVNATNNYWGTINGAEITALKDGSINSNPFAQQSVFAGTSVLVPSSNLSAQTSGNTITVAWDASLSTNVAKYYIYHNNGSGGVNYNVVIDSVAVSSTQWTSGSLQVGTVYRFGVRSKNTDAYVEPNFFLQIDAPCGGQFVSGEISQSTTWTKSPNSYYFVNGDITINALKILKIEPGVTVSFMDNYGITVDGGLYALGTATDSILFTSLNAVPAAGDWKALKFNLSSFPDTNRIKYARIEFGGESGESIGALHIDNGKVDVSHSIITNNDFSGITLLDGELNLDQSHITRSNQGIRANGGSLDLVNCDIYDNDSYGLYHVSGGIDSLQNCRFYKNANTAIYFHGDRLAILDSTAIYNNSQIGLEINGDLKMDHTFIENNTSGNTNFSGLLYKDGLLDISHTKISGNAIGAKIQAATTGSYIRNSRIESSGLNGIEISTANVSLENDIIQNNNQYGVILNGAATVKRSLVQQNDVGIKTSSTPTIDFNNIENNYTFNIQNDGSNDVDARYNWWGSATSSDISSGIWDKNDNSNLGTVQYQPFLTASVDISDEVAPSGLVLISPEDQEALGVTQPTFHWHSATDASGILWYKLFVDNILTATISDTFYQITSALSGATHTWYVMACDSVGNTSACEAWTFYLDSTPPNTFYLKTPSNSSIVSSTPTLSWYSSYDAGSGIAKYRIYLNDLLIDSVAASETSYTFTDRLSVGSYTWYIEAVDNAGNTQVSNETRSFTVSREGEFYVEIIGNYDESRDTVLIDYHINQPNNLAVSLTAYYRLNSSASWHNATLIGDYSNIQSADFDSTVQWNSRQDLPDVDSINIGFKISADDGSDTASDSITIHIDNNRIPEITINPITADQSGDVNIQFTVTDMENDSLQLLPMYLDPSNDGWHSATTSGVTAGKLSVLGNLIWHSKTDLPDALGNISFKITVFDLDEGDTDTLIIPLDNLGAPSIVILSNISEEVKGDISFDYKIDDANKDTVGILAEYSLDNGANWNLAFVSGDTSRLDSTLYMGTLIWHSAIDAAGVDASLTRFRLTGYDQHFGLPAVTSTFHLDNNMPPSVLSNLVYQEYSGNIAIPFVINDAEGDTITL